MDEELTKTQDLYKLLSIYKNQEYPEKLLQIKNLQKQLVDLRNLHEEETDDLLDMVTKETNRILKIQSEKEKDFVDKITNVSFKNKFNKKSFKSFVRSSSENPVKCTNH